MGTLYLSTLNEAWNLAQISFFIVGQNALPQNGLRSILNSRHLHCWMDEPASAPRHQLLFATAAPRHSPYHSSRNKNIVACVHLTQVRSAFSLRPRDFRFGRSDGSLDDCQPPPRAL